MESVKWKGLACLLLVTACLSAVSERLGHAYVLPAEQIVQFMASNFSKTQTLIVDQYCQETNEEKGISGFDEVLTMKSPDLFHSRIEDSDEKKGAERYYSYRQFFLANSPSRLLALLLEMGIDLQKVGYTRIDGVIAYRIGDTEDASPRVMVEKGRFLPLLVSYKAPGPRETVVKAKFLDYRKVEQAWYPFEILYSRADGITEKCTVRSLRVNRPVSPSHFGSK
jgi:hypothetical protein